QAVFCKRCFTSFDKQNLKYKLSGQAALDHHKLICGPHKPIRPKMPSEGEVLEFTAWQNTQRHPTRALLIKANERKGKNTTIIQKHCPMSYGFLVKASEDVPTELLREFNIPTEPVIYRGSESRQDVAKHFIENITDVAEKIEKLLETNIILNM
ncbi:DNA pol B 2 domain-containing protein, partial [Aphis craccivora]